VTTSALRRAALDGAIALVAADSSIVVLAVPDLLARFGGSITATAWTIAGYNVAACGGAAVLYVTRSSLRARPLLVVGLVGFAIATAGCAAAESLTTLVALRVVQGAGASLVLAGAIVSLGSGRVAASSVAGLAVGPAAGGFLTEAFDWRAIFVAQLPVVAAALAAAVGAATPELRRRAAGRAPVGPSIALLLSSAALVAVLFLVVLLLIEGRGLSPVAAAAVVSMLPAAALAARRWLPASAPIGLALLTCGLALLALSNGSLPLVTVALAASGCGVGLSLAPLSDATGLAGVAARHGGVVLGLALITPALAHDLSANARAAELQGAAEVVHARAPLPAKAVLAVRLYQQVHRADRGALPDLHAPFDDTIRWFPGAAGDLRVLERQLRAREENAVSAAFSRSFGIAALLASCALLASLAVAPVWRRRLAL
jgi:MFS family permease